MWRLRPGWLCWLRANAGKAYANAHHVYAACAAMGSDIMHQEQQIAAAATAAALAASALKCALIVAKNFRSKCGS